MSQKESGKQSAPTEQGSALPIQPTVNPIISQGLQRHQLKMASLNLMVIKVSEDINNLVTVLLLEIQKLQAENKTLKDQLESQKTKEDKEK